MTNTWIAQQRAVYRAELNVPAVWIECAAMLLSEGSPLQTFESLLNRTSYMRAHGASRSIHQMLHSGFYGPINRGELPTFIAEIRRSDALVEQMNTAIEAAMAGSDTIHGFTDQGLPSDPNGEHQPQIRIGGNVFNDWGGGPGGHAGAAAWRSWFEEGAKLPPAPPPPPSHDIGWLQASLNQLGASPTLQIDGQLGPATLAAIIRNIEKQLKLLP